MAWKFNPFTNELDYYEAGVVSGNVINVKGIITNADTNPAYPSTPAERDLWLIGTNSGTVGGTTVQPGDGILYISAAWVLWDMEIGSAVTVTASNGLTKTGNDIALGGTLTENTTVSLGATPGRTIALSSNTGSGLDISNSNNEVSINNTVAGFIALDDTGISILISNGGTNIPATIVDNRPSINRRGLEYGADYGTTFTARSLVDKGYVDPKSGTTANRSIAFPTPAIGNLYSNTDTSRLQWYDGSTWRSLPFTQILLTEIQNIANNRFLGNLSGISAPPQEIAGLDIWDSAQQSYTYNIAGINEWLNSTLFSQTASQTVANTVAETTLLGTGVGTLNLPASFFVVGKTLKGNVKGFIGDDVTPPTIRIQVKLNAVTILDTTATTVLAITGTRRFEVEFELTNRTTGVSGTIFSQGLFKYFRDNATEEKISMLNTATNTINTTIAQLLSVTVIWGTANANNTITSTNFNLTKLA